MEEKNFGYLGFNFQQSLIKAIIEHKKYGETIVDVLETKFFDNASFRYIIENLKELYGSYNKIPAYETLAQKMVSESGQDGARVHIDTLQLIKDSSDDVSFVMDRALNFCKQQNLKKELVTVNKILENGNFEEYYRIEQIIQKAMQVGISGDEAEDIFDNIDDALDKNVRHPIPTGVVGFDLNLKGGLGRGEIGLLIAATGIGKSTLLTKFANTAYNHGYNVLQIFFEDQPASIKRKHYTIWTGIDSDEQPHYAVEVKEKVLEAQNRSKGILKLLKLSSDGVTTNDIKNKIRKMIADGFTPDLVIIDYLDCISSVKSVNGEEWKGEGDIMRSLESISSEYNFACWVATQGGRCVSLDTIVTLEDKGDVEIGTLKVGDKILTHLGYKNVSHVFPIEKQPVYKITLKSGKTIKVSRQHKFPTINGEFKSIDSGLVVGDNLYTS